MTKEILIILACVPLYIINSFCDKYISARSANKNSHLYNCIKFFVGSLCLLPVFLSDGAPRFKLGAILCGVACGIIYAVNKTVIMKGYEASSVACMTLCHASGMIIPCVIGHFFVVGATELSVGSRYSANCRLHRSAQRQQRQ